MTVLKGQHVPAQLQKIKTEEGTAPGTSRIQAIGLLKTMSYVEDNIMKQRTQAYTFSGALISS